MDLNVVVLAGRLAAQPEVRTFESGATLMRLLVTVRSAEPRTRLDVIPVVQWNPDPNDIRMRNCVAVGFGLLAPHNDDSGQPTTAALSCRDRRACRGVSPRGRGTGRRGA